jgi:cytochrome P450
MRASYGPANVGDFPAPAEDHRQRTMAAMVGCAPMAKRDFPHASILEGIRFTAQVAVPNVAQGLLRRRRTAVAIASRTGADGLAHGFMASLKRAYGNGPLWIRVGGREAVLLLGEEAIRSVLDRSPEPFAADPEPKRSAMAHFQPDALTISRNPEWEDRRRFTEHVLESGPEHPHPHHLSAEIARIAVQEAERLGASFDWDAFNEAVRRAARRIILGEAAGEDDELSRMLGELMDKANPPGGGAPELREEFEGRVRGYVEAAQEGSLASLFAAAPQSELTNPAGQATHWLFALGDTLAINAFRCLALLAAFDEVRERVAGELAGEGSPLLEGCLQEAMRLWPTTPMLSRELTADIDWSGTKVPRGTQVVIVNSFNHRDGEAIPYADRFAPEEWLPGGDARERWCFNHFSHGPQGCPGAAIALQVGTTMLATLLRAGAPQLRGASLKPDAPIPHGLDFFALSFELAA